MFIKMENNFILKMFGQEWTNTIVGFSSSRLSENTTYELLNKTLTTTPVNSYGTIDLTAIINNLHNLTDRMIGIKLFHKHVVWTSSKQVTKRIGRSSIWNQKRWDNRLSQNNQRIKRQACL